MKNLNLYKPYMMCEDKAYVPICLVDLLYKVVITYSSLVYAGFGEFRAWAYVSNFELGAIKKSCSRKDQNV